MDKNWLEGNWQQLKGSVLEQWSKLTDVDLDAVKGKEEQLVGKLQEKYGLARLEAKKSVDEFKLKHAKRKEQK